ncbi:MAG: sulfurtransferase complex subunit TusD [Gammaproteobacteria bacterium]|nr:sulfurtransferase complex subunit TusD [Gammaproteobacteria bacterium]
MKFSIVIYAAPYSSEAAHSALRFARSVIDQGHELYRLFFFGDGVHNASQLAVVAQDENNLQQQWNDLIEKHGIDSVICVSSALRRGVLNQTEANRHDLGTASAYTSSEVAGLGQLVDAAIHSDRLVNFG